MAAGLLVFAAILTRGTDQAVQPVLWPNRPVREVVGAHCEATGGSGSIGPGRNRLIAAEKMIQKENAKTKKHGSPLPGP